MILLCPKLHMCIRQTEPGMKLWRGNGQGNMLSASLILFSRWLRWSLLFAKVLDRQVIGIRYPGYARILHRLKPLFSIKCFCLIFLNLYTSIWIFSFRECYGRCSRGNVVGTNYMQFCYVLVFCARP